MTDKFRQPEAHPGGATQRRGEAMPRQIQTAPDNDQRLQEAMDHVLREHADVLERLSKR